MLIQIDDIILVNMDNVIRLYPAHTYDAHHHYSLIAETTKSLGSDSHFALKKSYPTIEEVLDDMKKIMDAYQNGEKVCHI